MEKADFRRMTGVVVRLLTCLVGLAVTVGPVGPAIAQQQGLVVVGNDRGGRIGVRADEVDRINAIGSRVEIRGQICYSSCTMYLGADDLCINPTTSFGFHGPSDWGRPLSADSFDRWSHVMARYYNEPLREWFMTDGRYQQSSITQISGAQLIRLGYAPC